MTKIWEQLNWQVYPLYASERTREFTSPTIISRNSNNKIVFFSTTNISHYRRSEIKIGNDYFQGLIHRRKTHKLFIIIGPTWNIHLLDNSPSLIA